LHHTGERQQPRVSLEVKMRGLQGFAMKPGRVGLLSKPAWGDVPYHYYIDVSGKIAEGRDLSFAGDSTTAFDNDGSIQIVLEGDFEREQPAQEELKSLMHLVRWLTRVYGIAGDNIAGHGDFDQTDCPGRNLRPFMEEIRKALRQETAADRN
ncbi:MAG: N-acetylmuramoyl-L-alanine amidase, partial [Rhodomicrobium sp.]|nr:N-acetylmuramoyl-L-alanine amidase [Rhodomicrobium sp.]